MFSMRELLESPNRQRVYFVFIKMLDELQAFGTKRLLHCRKKAATATTTTQLANRFFPHNVKSKFQMKQLLLLLANEQTNKRTNVGMFIVKEWIALALNE